MPPLTKVTKFKIVWLIIFVLQPSQLNSTPPVPIPLAIFSPPPPPQPPPGGESNSASSFAIVAPDSSVVQILQPPAIGTLHHFFYNATPEGLVLKLVPFDKSNFTISNFTTAIPSSIIVKELHRDLQPPEVGEYWSPPPPPPPPPFASAHQQQQQQNQVQYGPPEYVPSRQELVTPSGGYGDASVSGGGGGNGGGLQLIKQAEETLKNFAKTIETSITKQSGNLNSTVDTLNKRIEKGTTGFQKFVKDVHEQKTNNFQELIKTISTQSRSLLDKIRGGLTALGKGVQELTQTIFEKEEDPSQILPVSPMEEYYGLSGIENVVFVEERTNNEVPGTEQPFNETVYQGGYSYG